MLAVCTVFIAFFVQLELRYFGLFPFFFLLIFFTQGVQDLKLKFSEGIFLEKYGLYALALLMFLGILGVLNFIGLSYQSAFFVLLTVIWGLRYLAYFLEYQDGKTLFKHGFLFVLFLLLGNAFIQSGFSGLSAMFGLTLLFAVLGF